MPENNSGPINAVKAAAQREVAGKEAEAEKARAQAKVQETRQKGARES
jgi:hypothetical protein